MLAFDRKDARLFLEICRHTYAAGVSDVRVMTETLQWINDHSTPTAPPLLLRGTALDQNSVACVVPYADRNVVAYMGT